MRIAERWTLIIQFDVNSLRLEVTNRHSGASDAAFHGASERGTANVLHRFTRNEAHLA